MISVFGAIPLQVGAIGNDTGEIVSYHDGQEQSRRESELCRHSTNGRKAREADDRYKTPEE